MIWKVSTGLVISTMVWSQEILFKTDGPRNNKVIEETKRKTKRINGEEEWSEINCLSLIMDNQQIWLK